MIDGNVRKQAPTMSFLQRGIIFDLPINSCCGLHAEQRRAGIHHHDKPRINAGGVHVLHKIVAVFIDHAVKESWYNHILCTTRFLLCPAFGRAIEETGWQKSASPNMAMTIDNGHFRSPHRQSSLRHDPPHLPTNKEYMMADARNETMNGSIADWPCDVRYWDQNTSTDRSRPPTNS